MYVLPLLCGLFVATAVGGAAYRAADHARWAGIARWTVAVGAGLTVTVLADLQAVAGGWGLMLAWVFAALFAVPGVGLWAGGAVKQKELVAIAPVFSLAALAGAIASLLQYSLPAEAEHVRLSRDPAPPAAQQSVVSAEELARQRPADALDLGLKTSICGLGAGLLGVLVGVEGRKFLAARGAAPAPPADPSPPPVASQKKSCAVCGGMSPDTAPACYQCGRRFG